MPKISITAATVNKLPLAQAGQQLYVDKDLKGFGVRVGTTTKAYYAEKRVDGRTVRHTLGMHGQITADQARKDAMVALGAMTKGADLNLVERSKKAARAAAEEAKAGASKHTLEKLCDWYVKHQTTKGKQSARDAENLFKNYVNTSEFGALPARDLTAKQATSLLRELTEQGKVRTAAKLRAYLRAAYALALGAETNAEAPAALVLFGVESNPIASTGALSSGNKTRDVVLTEAELGETLRLMAERRTAGHDDALAALELSLVLGGQRLAQVLRIEASNVDLDAGTITLLDSKGRRKVARRHVLPLTETAAELVKGILAVRRGAWLFGDADARTVPDTVARKGSELLRQAQENVAKVVKGPERPAIQARDLRRTAETMMAAMGISKDLRAQLQSHGLGGVQDRHYDKHDYLQEKLTALEAWDAHLRALAERKPAASNVTKLNRTVRKTA